MAHHTSAAPRDCYIRFYDISIKAGFQTESNVGGGHHWSPPNSRNAFQRRGETNWMLWRNGELTPAPPHLIQQRKLFDHSVSSLFFCPQRHGVVHVPYDCFEEDIMQQEEMEVRRGWLPISFELPDRKIREQNNRLWLVGRNMPEPFVKMPISDSWEDYLGPTYFENGSYGANLGRTCDLAGDLSILYGLVAMTCPWDDVLQQFSRSLIPSQDNSYIYIPTWYRGITAAAGKHPRRGLVCKIAYEVDAYNRTVVDNYERGHHGAIFTSHESNQRLTTIAPQPPLLDTRQSTHMYQSY